MTFPNVAGHGLGSGIRELASVGVFDCVTQGVAVMSSKECPGQRLRGITCNVYNDAIGSTMELASRRINQS